MYLKEKDLLKAISDSIKKLHHKTTQLIIAHRLSTILHADQIVVLDHGRIAATGKHEELLNNPIYKRLYYLQFHNKWCYNAGNK